MTLVWTKLCVVVAVAASGTTHAEEVHRRLRKGNHLESYELSEALYDITPDYRNLFTRTTDTAYQGMDELEARFEAVQSAGGFESMSLPPTQAPEPLTVIPSETPSEVPSITPTVQTSYYFPSDSPSYSPSTAATEYPYYPSQFMSFPSQVPSIPPQLTVPPTVAVSEVPSSVPSFGTQVPSVKPPITVPPTAVVSEVPSSVPSLLPSEVPSDVPSHAPSAMVTMIPSRFPVTVPPVSLVPSLTPLTAIPTPLISEAPSDVPSYFSSAYRTTRPTFSYSCGLAPEVRIIQIIAILEVYVDIGLLRNTSTPEGLATLWLIAVDVAQVCPGEDTPDSLIVQRWSLAILYFSTNGDGWYSCSALGTDDCGAAAPFQGQSRFLSGESECNWAGVTCDDGFVTKLAFVNNNLNGTIPNEIGLLSNLQSVRMEQGGLVGSIPKAIGSLTRLTFWRVAFNFITGTLPGEFMNLIGMLNLGLNNNQLSGSIESIGAFPSLRVLQLHDNSFSGAIPETLGRATNLRAVSLQHTNLTGSMPTSVCGLVDAGTLTKLVADCAPQNQTMGLFTSVACPCCTSCRGA